MREESKKVLSHLPGALSLAKRTEEHMKGMVSAATLFEEMGFRYVGPVDGHDLDALTQTLDTLSRADGPQFLHIKTCKGKGFLPAEADPIGYHAITKLEKPGDGGAKAQAQAKAPKPPAPAKRKYCAVFGEWLCDMAAADPRLLGITPAMREGSDLVRFSKEYPERYFDVAIAEQHAVTLAAGMACEAAKPVVAIYSTFLQRGYDQLIHDVAVQNLDVTFAIDRAGLVGEDGPTHHGSMDISYLRCVPGMIILAPADEAECRAMLSAAYHHPGPAAVRYPRGTGPGVAVPSHLEPIPIGRAERRRESRVGVSDGEVNGGPRIALLAFGNVNTAVAEVAEALDATHLNMRSVKPLDRDAVLHAADDHELLVTLEENVIAGGAGSAVGEFLAAAGVQVEMLHLGLPDAFVEHGTPAQLLADCGLDAAGIERAIRRRLATD